MEIGVVGNPNVATCSVKGKRLPHLAWAKSHAPLQCSVISASNICSIALTRPPTDQSWRRWHANSHRQYGVGTSDGTEAVPHDNGVVANIAGLKTDKHATAGNGAGDV